MWEAAARPVMRSAPASAAARRGLRALGCGSHWDSGSGLLVFDWNSGLGSVEAPSVLLGLRWGLDPWAGARALSWDSDWGLER